MEVELIKGLLEILKKEYACLKRLNQLVLKKEEAIIKNDVARLTELLGKDQGILEETKALEKERLNLISQLTNLYNLATEDLRFKDLQILLPDLWQEELTAIKAKLLNIIAELQKGNEKNRVLIAEALKINEFSRGIFLNILHSNNQLYNKKGVENSTSQHILDQKS